MGPIALRTKPVIIFPVPECVRLIDILLASRVSHCLLDPRDEGYYDRKGQMRTVPFQVELPPPSLPRE